MADEQPLSLFTAPEPEQGGLTDEQKRQNVIRLVFDSRPERFDAFCRAICDVVPDGTRVVLRGSAVTGRRWNDGAQFDADGPGTSDVDLTLVGHEVVSTFDPDIAPELVALRRTLMEMVRRPVNIQASLDLVLYLRGDLLGQPYLTIIDGDRDS